MLVLLFLYYSSQSGLRCEKQKKKKIKLNTKTEFLLIIFQKYAGLIFGKSLKVLSRDEQNHVFYNKTRVIVDISFATKTNIKIFSTF